MRDVAIADEVFEMSVANWKTPRLMLLSEKPAIITEMAIRFCNQQITTLSEHWHTDLKEVALRQPGSFIVQEKYIVAGWLKGVL